MDLLNAGADIGYNFASNKVFEAYNKQVSNLRETLLGNKISYSSSGNTEMDKATKAYHNKVFAYSTALQILEQVTQSSLNKKLAATKAKEEDNMLNTYYDKQVPQAKKADNDITEYYDKLNKTSENTISSNINQALIADKAQDQYGLDVAARRDELDKLTYKNWTGNEGIGTNAEGEKRIKKFWEDHKGGDEISEDLKSSGFESNSVTFPRPGETIETHKTENGIKFVNRAKFEILNDGKKETIFKGWSKNGKPDEDKYSTPSNPMSEKVARMVEEYRRANPGSYKFFIEKLHGKGVNDKFFGKNPIQEGKTRSDFPNRMLFPAYINAFNDSYDATWNSYNFIGRGEEVGIYNKTARKLSLDFYIISDFSAELLVNAIEEERASSNPAVKATGDSKLNFKKPDLNMNSFSTAKDMVMNAAQGGGNALKGLSKEETLSELKRLLPDWGTGAYPIPGVVNGEWSGTIGGQISGTPEMLWARLTFLAQCVYPWYRKDGKLKEQPMVRIRIGDFIDAVE
jgi:hypothetical protein